MAISTTIEQSKHLLVKLGLDPKTADMCWVKDYTGQWVLITDTQINVRSRLEGMYEYSGFQWQEHIALVPAWSLSALLEVMPRPDLYRETADLWVCASFFKEGSIRGFGETAIDAACDNITKMFGRGYLKKKGGEE